MSAVPTYGCDAEPIHVPGSIQGFGVLLALDPEALIVTGASANAAALLGPTPALGRPIEACLAVTDAGPPLREVLRQLGPSAPVTVRARAVGAGHAPERAVTAHRHGRHLLVEVELAPPPAPATLARLHAALATAVAAVQGSADAAAMAVQAASQVRALTGYDRVMVYRFDHAWNGEVVAESRAAAADGYLGQHFPASDIPAQARAMLLDNWVRMIPDAGYTPVPLLPAGAPALDLSHSLLRSVSPVHLEYLANMGVGGTMTVSLRHRGRLWGILACHHLTPRHTPATVRDACALVARLCSALLEVHERGAERRAQARHGRTLARLGAQVEASDSMLGGLIGGQTCLLDLVDAGGAATARGDGTWACVGRTPPPAALDAVAAWLDGQPERPAVAAIASLPPALPELAPHAEVAAGVLAMAVVRGARRYVLWFRPEVVRTIPWAGQPEKNTVRTARGEFLHPRQSFSRWEQVVRDQALPFAAGEVAAVEQLRQRIIAADLVRQLQRETRARAEREHVVGVVSHDLRNPLAGIELTAQTMGRWVSAIEAPPKARESLTRAVQRVLTGCRRMRGLIEDVLCVVQVEAGTFAVDRRPTPAQALLDEAQELLEPLARAQGLRLVCRSEAPTQVLACDPGRVMQVFSNLVGNAIKFTPPAGEIAVAVTALPTALRFCVGDTGPGIPAEHLPRIFDRFWQADRRGAHGAGLGLAIAKGIVEAHGGHIWAESDPGAGARFYFTLPTAA